MSRPSAAHNDNIRLAIYAILFTVLALALGDAFIKRFSTDFTLWQIFVIRSAIALPILIVALKLRYHDIPLRPQSLQWTAIRSLLLTLMWICYYAALPHTELSVAAAAYYTSPLFITLFAAIFLGDAIGPTRWIAVFLGFCGVLLILKPQTEDFNTYALLPIVSAILYALAMIITRSKCRNENVLVLSLALNASMIAAGAMATILLLYRGPTLVDMTGNPFLLGPWTAMAGQEWLAMGLLALALIIGSVGAAVAYQSGPSSIVGTFDFAYVAFAAGLGFLFFAEIPDITAITGIVLIMAAGVLAIRR